MLCRVYQSMAIFCVMLVAAPMSGAVHIETEKPAVVIVFGDSITAGFSREGNDLNGNPNVEKGIGSGQTDFGLPDQFLSKFLAESRRNAVVVNWGYGGTSSTFGEMRISGNTAQTANEYDGSQYLILIMYGTNDNGQGISPSTTGFNIRNMIIRARSNGYIPFVGSLTPRDDEDVTPYNASIHQAAVTSNPPAVFVDHFTNYETVAPPDGFALLTSEFSNFKQQTVRLHPTNEGYEVIAQHWFDTVLADLIEPHPVVIAPILLLLDD
jgi:lysophospholipase L1-like esterase